MSIPAPDLPPKSDDAMPFYGGVFFNAIEGYSNHVAMGYLRALWKYWNHTHCDGLSDEDEYLREICHCPESEWARTKGVIFDNHHFFCLNGDGKWHQKRAKEAHQNYTLAKQEQDKIRAGQVARAAYARSKIGTKDSDYLSGGDLTPAREVTLRGVFERNESAIKDLIHSYDSHMPWSAADRRKYSELIGRRKTLREVLHIPI